MNEAESLRIGWKLQQRLLAAPESGMGYQFVTLEGLGAFVVLNATIALQLDDASDKETGQEPLASLDGEIARAIKTIEADKFAWLPSKAELSETAKELEAPIGTKLHVATHGSYPSTPETGELFVRYSAFVNDLRFNNDGSVREGTYVTTEIDSAMVPSGLTAVARYAPPNKHPAKYKFYIDAPVTTTIQCGTSAPKFGESGGGVEILLGYGARRVANGANTIAER